MLTFFRESHSTTGFDFCRRVGQSTRRGTKGAIISGCLSLTLFFFGCAKAKTSASIEIPDQAKVIVTNRSDYEWKISVTAQSGGPARVAKIAARATCELAVPAGDYFVEQTLLATDFAADNTRRFPLKVAPRQTYRWALATLLSDANDELEPPLETARR